MSALTTNGHRVDTGCWVDSHHGHYVGMEAILLAIRLGWDDIQAAQAAYEYPDHGGDPAWEFYPIWFDIIDAAEGWLNSHTEGGVWQFWEGNLMLWTNSEYDEENE